jgi:uracil phosphoribosyltransferase
MSQTPFGVRIAPHWGTIPRSGSVPFGSVLGNCAIFVLENTDKLAAGWDNGATNAHNWNNSKKTMKQDPRFPNLFILNHPLIQHKLSHMRERDTSTRTFRELLKEITLLMGYEITRDLPLTTRKIETPLETIDAPVIAGKKLAIVPILRAGIGMSDGLLELVPSARVGHVGVFRDPETHKPVEYLVRLPDTADRIFILCDPMVATGNSAVHAVDVLKKRGVTDEQIIFLALVAAPEGVTVFQASHPGVKLYVASLDSHLNDHAYIVPGLGDAGDRIFGTK